MIECRRSTPAELQALSLRLGYLPTLNFRGVTTRRNDQLGVIIGFDRWTETSVHIHSWIIDPRAVTRYSLRESLGFPFQTRELLIGMVAGDNVKALRFNTRLGFNETYRFREGHARGVDLVVMEMRRDECRWLGE